MTLKWFRNQVSDVAALHRRNRKLRGRGEFLSGFRKTDRLTPVITLVIHFGEKPWDGPLSLHEMMDIPDPAIKNLVSDYQIHLIDPARMTQKELEKFSTSLREVLGFIKYSGDQKRLTAFVRRNQRMRIEQDALLVIKTITKTPLKIPEQEEKIDMCKAIDDMIKENMEIGKKEGRTEGEIGLILKMYKNHYTVEQIASAIDKSTEEVEAIVTRKEPVLL